MADENHEREEPIIRDKRRIDPETGEVRKPADSSASDAGVDESGSHFEPLEGPDVETSMPPADDESDAAPEGAAGESEGEGEADAAGDDEPLTVDDILNAAQAEVDEPTSEHLADLKRVTAEYANYRKRTEANREVERERAVGKAVAVLLPVLDDLDRAEKHGDLEGDAPFATIAAKLRGAVEKLGLAPFGEAGEVFDPQRHEAIFQQPSDEVEVDTVADVVETGYYLGSTLLRAAKVVVKTPQ
ncbi:nucleotide exchange factor GrpE [Agromyces mangrovi Wang et al. 2018]|uniref:nucleotide exchange factor GrpE n=1 Tax=Agromyces mangrovi TaxID=1858653 RepID=UPI0025725A08|nr:nucleotide exchange factor GrpE [Agromyces mangrovi]BDZ64490.1 protein GrpE [Agromyces mangrovi]